MKKYIGILAALLLVGCSQGNEVICSQGGELFYRPVIDDNSMNQTQVTSVLNTKQFCTNQSDGSILIKPRK